MLHLHWELSGGSPLHAEYQVDGFAVIQKACRELIFWFFLASPLFSPVHISLFLEHGALFPSLWPLPSLPPEGWV